MAPDELATLNRRLRGQSPAEIIAWAVSHAGGNIIVSTNFRPYEAVILHLAVQANPDIPVLWVDHGFNRPATYRHAQELQKLLGLNIKALVPAVTAAHYEALHGPPPGPEDEAALREFSAVLKLEPFQRGM